MNPIQKAWLKVLSPVVTLVNEKMAKRSGLIGKFGRFFAFGPRQFGYHPINKFLAMTNLILLQSIPMCMHRYSVIKNLNQGTFYNSRIYVVPSLLGMLVIYTTLLYCIIPGEFVNEEGTTLEHLTRAGLPAHYNALNDRISAHYTEINSLYGYEMMKRLDTRVKEIERKRNSVSEEEKRTRFARPGYKYIAAHTKAN